MKDSPKRPVPRKKAVRRKPQQGQSQRQTAKASAVGNNVVVITAPPKAPRKRAQVPAAPQQAPLQQRKVSVSGASAIPGGTAYPYYSPIVQIPATAPQAPAADFGAIMKSSIDRQTAEWASQLGQTRQELAAQYDSLAQGMGVANADLQRQRRDDEMRMQAMEYALLQMQQNAERPSVADMAVQAAPLMSEMAAQASAAMTDTASQAQPRVRRRGTQAAPSVMAAGTQTTVPEIVPEPPLPVSTSASVSSVGNYDQTTPPGTLAKPTFDTTPVQTDPPPSLLQRAIDFVTPTRPKRPQSEASGSVVRTPEDLIGTYIANWQTFVETGMNDETLYEKLERLQRRIIETEPVLTRGQKRKSLADFYDFLVSRRN